MRGNLEILKNKAGRRLLNLYLNQYSKFCRFIFIVTPIRSGSSLLQHIIAQIDGCATVGETHLRYRKPRDLSRLIRRVCEESGLSYFRRRTFLDKITADNQMQDVELFNPDLVKVVFLLRQPAPTIANLSKLKLWPRVGTSDVILNYYRGRLTNMVHQAEQLRHRNRGFF
jgi:hypothetical protein